jgi:hypothetical protein
LLTGIWKTGITQSVKRLCYELDNIEIGLQFPTGARDISLLYSDQTLSGDNATSCTMSTGISFPKGKGGVRMASHLHLVPGLGMMELYLHSRIPSWLDALVINHTENIYLYPEYIGNRSAK